MIKAIIFDFDYTLGDSTNGIVLSVNYALEKLKYSAKDTEAIRKTIGLSLKDTFWTLTKTDNMDEAEQFAKYFIEKADIVMVENTQLYDDVKEVLSNLKAEGFKIGIVTTKLRYRIEQILNKFNVFDLVDIIIGAEDVKIEKPAPDGLLQVIDRLKLSKEDILYVGDSLVDAKTAENAQVNFAGVLTGTTTREEFGLHRNVFIGAHVKEVYDFIMKKA
ncbi:MAG: HAD-IA family hydrolase [Clostridiales bacterium]|nr:HAD-IA family hydrolase [Clostridiales bacterium]